MTTPTKSVLITGAAKRVGRAIALELAAHGWSVAVHYNHSEAEAEETVAALHKLHVHAMAINADLTSEDDTQRLIERAYEGVGPLTALVNNASVFEKDNLATMTRATWDKHMEANLRAPLVLSQAFVQQLPEGYDGVIVNVLDQLLFKPLPQFFSYCLSKAAMHWSTGALAHALAPRVRVNAVAPGPTVRHPRQSEAHFLRMTDSTMLGRGATPEDIARAVRFLIEDTAITAQTITVAG